MLIFERKRNMNHLTKTILREESDQRDGWNTPANRAIAVISILYTVGITGILGQLHPDFIRLTPLNLLITLGLVLWHHPRWKQTTLLFILLTYLVGFGAELFGVQTGLLFGDYTYGEVLGWKVWGTPLMIGVNWVIVSYGAGVTVNRLAGSLHWLTKALLAAALMVGLDLLIEPVAVEYGFWTWAGDQIPLRNYLGWFLVAFPLQAFFMYHLGEVRNKVGVALFIWQIIFFTILGVAI